MTKGNPDIKNYSQIGYDAEITALYILENEGYKIICAPEKTKREYQVKRKEFHNTEIYKKHSKVSDKLIELRKKHNAPIDHHSKNISNDVKRIMKKARDEFYKIDEVYSKELHKLFEWREKKSNVKILDEKLGESLMPQINKKEWEQFLKTSIDGSLFHHSFVDIFCKKGNDYYVFDIKHKTYKENTNLNTVYVTNYEVLNYDRIVKENKVKLKIMIIIRKQKKSVYKIFDWSDFRIPKTFDPHTKRKTSIHLKNGLNMDIFNTF